MKRGTLRWASAAAACALILLAIWLLVPTGSPAPSTESKTESRLSTRGPEPTAPRAVPAEAAGPETAAEMEASPRPTPLVPEKPQSRRVVVEGKVVGLGNEPVAGAEVLLLLPPTAEFDVVVAQGAFIPDPRWAPPFAQDVFSFMREGATTGEDGTFRIETAACPSAGLIAWGGAYANTLVEPFSLEEDVKGLVLRMEPAVAVSGRVMEAVGPHLNGRAPAPLEGVAVSLLQPVPGGRWIHLRSETTDAEGRFRTWGWTPGRYDLHAEKEGMRRVLIRSVEIPADSVEIRMLPGATAAISGTVFLPDGTTPTEGVRVTATPRATGDPLEPSAHAATDADGRFRIAGLEIPGGERTCSLKVEADGGARGAATHLVRAWAGDGDIRMELVARPTSVLRVRVVDGSRSAGRAPAAGVRLVARGSQEDPAGRSPAMAIERDFRTDAAGAAEVKGLPDRNVRLSPAEDEWGWEFEKIPFLRVPDAPAEGPWEIEIEVYPRGRVRGIVVGPGGDPVPGARVEVDPGAAPAAARTGPDGRFTLLGVTSRRAFSLQASAQGFLPGRSNAVSLEPGSTLEGIVIRLPAALGAICGRVVDEEGNPRPEILVRAHPANEGVREGPVSAWTGAGGRFRIEVPPGTTWNVGVEMKGFAWLAAGPLLPGDPVPDLVLRPLAPAK